ncbi:MAG: MFS transporter [Chloroflexi bacterium]|nr:MFS transporter [Chloroflexota bacterium]
MSVGRLWRFRNYRSPVVDVLSDAQFRALIASQAIFDLGIFMRGAANSWVILELTHSQLWIGLVAGVRAFPILLLALFGGVISDRFGRRNLMMAAGTLMVVASAITAVLISTGALVSWHLIALSVLGGVGGALYGPAFFALLGDIVRSDRLVNANGILAVAQTSGEMLGPLIVGFVIVASGTHTVFWLVVAGNTFGLMLLLRVREPERDPSDSRASFASQLVEGLRYARDTPPLLWLTLLVMVQNLFAVAIFPLMPIYADEILNIGPGGFGLMGGVFGAGLLAGAAVVAIVGIHHRHAFVLLAAGVVWDIAMVSFGFSRSLPLSLGLLFVMGLAGMPWVTAALTMFQQAATREMRGRVMSLYVIAMNMFPLGWLFGGAVAQWLGNEEALIISAMLGSPVAAAALLLSKELRRA